LSGKPRREVRLSSWSTALLRQWLLDREDDIAWGMEDLGELTSVFAEVVGRPAFRRSQRPQAGRGRK